MQKNILISVVFFFLFWVGAVSAQGDDDRRVEFTSKKVSVFCLDKCIFKEHFWPSSITDAKLHEGFLYVFYKGFRTSYLKVFDLSKMVFLIRLPRKVVFTSYQKGSVHIGLENGCFCMFYKTNKNDLKLFEHKLKNPVTYSYYCHTGRLHVQDKKGMYYQFNMQADKYFTLKPAGDIENTRCKGKYSLVNFKNKEAYIFEGKEVVFWHKDLDLSEVTSIHTAGKNLVILGFKDNSCSIFSMHRCHCGKHVHSNFASSHQFDSEIRSVEAMSTPVYGSEEIRGGIKVKTDLLGVGLLIALKNNKWYVFDHDGKKRLLEHQFDKKIVAQARDSRYACAVTNNRLHIFDMYNEKLPFTCQFNSTVKKAKVVLEITPSGVLYCFKGDEIFVLDLYRDQRFLIVDSGGERRDIVFAKYQEGLLLLGLDTGAVCAFDLRCDDWENPKRYDIAKDQKYNVVKNIHYDGKNLVAVDWTYDSCIYDIRDLSVCKLQLLPKYLLGSDSDSDTAVITYCSCKKQDEDPCYHTDEQRFFWYVGFSNGEFFVFDSNKMRDHYRKTIECTASKRATICHERWFRFNTVIYAKCQDGVVYVGLEDDDNLSRLHDDEYALVLPKYTLKIFQDSDKRDIYFGHSFDKKIIYAHYQPKRWVHVGFKDNTFAIYDRETDWFRFQKKLSRVAFEYTFDSPVVYARCHDGLAYVGVEAGTFYVYDMSNSNKLFEHTFKNKEKIYNIAYAKYDEGHMHIRMKDDDMFIFREDKCKSYTHEVKNPGSVVYSRYDGSFLYTGVRSGGFYIQNTIDNKVLYRNRFNGVVVYTKYYSQTGWLHVGLKNEDNNFTIINTRNRDRRSWRCKSEVVYSKFHDGLLYIVTKNNTLYVWNLRINTKIFKYTFDDAFLLGNKKLLHEKNKIVYAGGDDNFAYVGLADNRFYIFRMVDENNTYYAFDQHNDCKKIFEYQFESPVIKASYKNDILCVGLKNNQCCVFTMGPDALQDPCRFKFAGNIRTLKLKDDLLHVRLKYEKHPYVFNLKDEISQRCEEKDNKNRVFWYKDDEAFVDDEDRIKYLCHKYKDEDDVLLKDNRHAIRVRDKTFRTMMLYKPRFITQ